MNNVDPERRVLIANIEMQRSRQVLTLMEGSGSKKFIQLSAKNLEFGCVILCKYFLF